MANITLRLFLSKNRNKAISSPSYSSYSSQLDRHTFLPLLPHLLRQGNREAPSTSNPSHRIAGQTVPVLTSTIVVNMKNVTLLALALLLMVLSCRGFLAPMQPRAAASTSAIQMTVLTYGNKKKDFKPGSPLAKACAALGVKPKYSCKKGDCATCQILVAGQFTRACIGKVPPEPKLKSLQENGLPISV